MTTAMELDDEDEGRRELTVQFVSERGDVPFPPFTIPKSVTKEKLKVLLDAFRQTCHDDDDHDSHQPFLFFINGHEIRTDVHDCLQLTAAAVDFETTLNIVYQPQAVFRVRPVSRCTSSMPGHADVVTVAQFSPSGRHLASGSGDKTVRFWDLSTETPLFECGGHRGWVLALSWAPDGSAVASGDRAGLVAVWDPESGKQKGKWLSGHRGFVTGLAWEPLHRGGRRLASSSKDGDVRVWDVALGRCLMTLTSHTMNVTCMKWGGCGLIYSASQDRTIKVWRVEDGSLCRTLQGHGHWVNVLALSTDYVMRTGAFDPATAARNDENGTEATAQAANKRYNRVVSTAGGDEEMMVSGSDDFTLFLWKPASEKKSLARMTGHQQLVNDVKFSPDARLVASASFDKSLRLWNGKTGAFVAVFRGHVQSVYQLAWSADSRMLVSGSADSTLKLWSVAKKKLDVDLPGHGDEIYAVDWSPDGQRVVSAGKDKLLRIWRK